LDRYNNSIYIYGGYSFSKNENQAISVDMDVLKLILKGIENGDKTVELFSGEKIKLNSIENKGFQQLPQGRVKSHHLFFKSSNGMRNKMKINRNWKTSSRSRSFWSRKRSCKKRRRRRPKQSRRRRSRRRRKTSEAHLYF
jgi:hypothetical protein